MYLSSATCRESIGTSCNKFKLWHHRLPMYLFSVTTRVATSTSCRAKLSRLKSVVLATIRGVALIPYTNTSSRTQLYLLVWLVTTTTRLAIVVAQDRSNAVHLYKMVLSLSSRGPTCCYLCLAKY